MEFVSNLIREVQFRIEGNDQFTPEFFNDYANVKHGKDKCHERVVDLIKAAAKSLQGVAGIVRGNEVINHGSEPKWKPDVVPRNERGDELCVVEYESLNSSDVRVIEKDVYGYESWCRAGRVPLLIITTLPNHYAPSYDLRWARQGHQNREHSGKKDQIRQNPFHYWYGVFRFWLSHRIQRLPILFANISGNALTLLQEWPVEPTRWVPNLDDGADWSGKWPATKEIENTRKAYKKELWTQTDPATLKQLSREFWAKEQEQSGIGWSGRAEQQFLLGVNRIQIKEEACKLIENVQWNMYGQSQ